MQGHQAAEKTMKAILKNLEKDKDYRYYLYLTLIYTGGRASQILNLLRDIEAGKVKKYEDFGDIVAFDITKYGKGKKRGFFAIMPKWLGDELLRNKDLFKNMPKSEKNIKFLKTASKKKAGAINVRDWFFKKALYKLECDKTMINFIQSRNDKKGAWQNYVNIKQALEGDIKRI